MTLTENLTATLEVEGKDKFYYSDSHNFQSQAYKLVNARLAYQANGYQLTAYINNATDKDYGVRGFLAGMPILERVKVLMNNPINSLVRQKLLAYRSSGFLNRFNF